MLKFLLQADAANKLGLCGEYCLSFTRCLSSLLIVGLCRHNVVMESWWLMHAKSQMTAAFSDATEAVVDTNLSSTIWTVRMKLFNADNLVITNT